MTTFQEREQAFEAKFAHDEEFRFLVTARRDKLLAHWAAARFHLSDPAKVNLTTALLEVRDGAGHDERVLQRLEVTLADDDGDVQRAELVAALHACAAQAERQLLEGTARP